VWEGSKNVVLWVEPRALGVVGVSGASSYGVLLAPVWILWVEWAWLNYMCLHHKFYDNRSFLWHFQLWYTIFVYALVHVMCLCVCMWIWYVNDVCCMMICIRMIETTKITIYSLIRNLIKLLDEYGLKKKLTYVKDEGSILMLGQLF
jgi:hypothetical protein